MVLAHLVVGIAKTGLSHRQLSQLTVALRLHQYPGNRLAGTVEQGLRAHVFIDTLSLTRPVNDRVNDTSFFVHA